MSELRGLPVGGKVWFHGERQGYTVRARNDRYLICTKPFNPRRTVLYTIIDLQEGIRGTENLVFGFGAETDEQCWDMLERLTEPRLTPVVDHDTGEPTGAFGGTTTEVSRRNRVPLLVTKCSAPGRRVPSGETKEEER